MLTQDPSQRYRIRRRVARFFIEAGQVDPDHAELTGLAIFGLKDDLPEEAVTLEFLAEDARYLYPG